MGHLTTRYYVGMFDDASYHALHAFFGWSGADADAGAQGVGVADVRHETDYFAEVGAGDLLEISCRLEKLGTKSVSIAYDMFNLTRQETAARLVQVAVCFDTKRRCAIPWPGDFRSRAQPFLPQA